MLVILICIIAFTERARFLPDMILIESMALCLVA